MNATHDLPHSTPERQGIASSAILQVVEALENQLHEIHSFVLLRHGYVVAEGWWSPYKREYPHMLFSVSKSFTSTAVGLAVAEGRLTIDDPVLAFFPEETPDAGSDFLAAMRVRHLLSMTTGHAVDTWAQMVERPDGDWIRGFMEAPVLHAPGTRFLYNTGATYMLAAIIQKTTGMKLIDYLTPRLFEPLGIENATWQESPQGIAMGGIGLSITTEGMARFGQLYLQKGRWQEKQILGEAWVEEATAAQVSNGDTAESDWAQGYGYQFWRCRHNAYRADGVFGQYCIVMPEQDAVLAMTSGIDIFDSQQPLNLVWKLLLPAMQPAPLADDAVTQDALAKRLSSLTLSLVQGGAVSAISTQVSGRTYTVDANEMQIDTITLSFSAFGCTARVITADDKETIPCGYEQWQAGQTHLFDEPRLYAPALVAASGAWTADDIFTMIVRLYETPFFHTLMFHFAGDELMVETWVNVSLEAPKRLLLTAKTI